MGAAADCCGMVAAGGAAARVGGGWGFGEVDVGFEVVVDKVAPFAALNFRCCWSVSLMTV